MKKSLQGLLSIPETAKLLGLSSAKVRSLVFKKELPAVKLGARYLIPRPIINKLLHTS